MLTVETDHTQHTRHIYKTITTMEFKYGGVCCFDIFLIISHSPSWWVEEWISSSLITGDSCYNGQFGFHQSVRYNEVSAVMRLGLKWNKTRTTVWPWLLRKDCISFVALQRFFIVGVIVGELLQSKVACGALLRLPPRSDPTSHFWENRQCNCRN